MILTIIFLILVWSASGVWGIFVCYQIVDAIDRNDMRQNPLIYLIAGICLGFLVWHDLLTEELRNG